MGKELAESEIFRLTKKAEECLRAGQISEYNCIRATIASIQENNKVFYGKERTPNARGNDSGSQVGD